MQDEIVIFNEVIDTMRAIMNIFKYKKGKLLRKKKTAAGAASPSPRKTQNVHTEFGIRNELVNSGN